MTAPKLKTLLGHAGLSKEDLARLLELHDRTVRRWDNGEIEIPRYVSLLCELMQLPAVRAYLVRTQPETFDFPRS